MDRRQSFIILCTLSLMLTCVSASTLQIQGPISGSLNNGGTIYLGKIGPGQSFYISASADTLNASGTYVKIAWDTLNATSLPSGWTSQASPLYADPMKMKITVPADAQNGTYKMQITAIDLQNYSRVANVTFSAYINVTPNVFSLSVTPTAIEVGPGQPTNLYVTINNTGVSDNPFIISAQGLPAWNVTDSVIALHLTQSQFVYPIYVGEPGVYSFNLTVSSSASQLIRQSYQIHLTSHASVTNDYDAVGQGILLTPVMYEPAYAFMLFLGQVYKAITGK